MTLRQLERPPGIPVIYKNSRNSHKIENDFESDFLKLYFYTKNGQKSMIFSILL